MTDAKALEMPERFIADWTKIISKLPKEINAGSICIGQNQIEALRICAARLHNDTKDQMENVNKYQAGWRQIGKHFGHFFLDGEIISLCKRETRGEGEILENCTVKCAVCKMRLNDPQTINLFGEID